MKKDIHPSYYTDATITCACGNSWQTGSTAKEIHVELCSSCHPFFTGKKRLVDVMGRVEKFKQRAAKKIEKHAKTPRKTPRSKEKVQRD